MAETVRETHERLSRFSQGRCPASVHAPGFHRIGGAAYFVWAYPPNGGRTAHTHGAEKRRTTSTLTP